MSPRAGMDWRAWHAAYEDPSSELSRRLEVVRGRIRDWLDATPGEVRIVSACAGDGRDLLGALAGRADAGRVHAVLIELEPAGAVAADGVELRRADAGRLASYRGAVPAQLLLMCGVFGNVPDAHVRRTVTMLPRLLADGGTVIWTRSRRPPDLTPAIRGWFAHAGFEEQAFDAPADALFSVGVNRLVAPARPLGADDVLFRFTSRRRSPRAAG